MISSGMAYGVGIIPLAFFTIIFAGASVLWGWGLWRQLRLRSAFLLRRRPILAEEDPVAYRVAVGIDVLILLLLVTPPLVVSFAMVFG